MSRAKQPVSCLKMFVIDFKWLSPNEGVSNSSTEPKDVQDLAHKGKMISLPQSLKRWSPLLNAMHVIKLRNQSGAVQESGGTRIWPCVGAPAWANHDI